MSKYSGSDFTIMLAQTKDEGKFKFSAKNKDSDKRFEYIINRSNFGSTGPKHTIVSNLEEAITKNKRKGDDNKMSVFDVMIEGPMTLNDISTALIGKSLIFDRSTIYRHLRSLIKEEWVDQVGSGKSAKYIRRPL